MFFDVNQLAFCSLMFFFLCFTIFLLLNWDQLNVKTVCGKYVSLHVADISGSTANLTHRANIRHPMSWMWQPWPLAVAPIFAPYVFWPWQLRNFWWSYLASTSLWPPTIPDSWSLSASPSVWSWVWWDVTCWCCFRKSGRSRAPLSETPNALQRCNLAWSLLVVFVLFFVFVMFFPNLRFLVATFMSFFRSSTVINRCGAPKIWRQTWTELSQVDPNFDLAFFLAH